MENSIDTVSGGEREPVRDDHSAVQATNDLESNDGLGPPSPVSDALSSDQRTNESNFVFDANEELARLC